MHPAVALDSITAQSTGIATELKRALLEAPRTSFSMGETRISSAQALVADSAAIMHLLDEVPDAGEICIELSKPYFTRRWRHSDQHSFWIASDGTTAVCHTLTGLELDEVIALWLSFDDYRRRPGFTLSASSLGKIIETELGLTVELDA